jgi:hypothetical protein
MTLRTDPPHSGFQPSPAEPTARNYFVPLFWGVFLIVNGIVFVTKGELSEWQDCFIRASRHMLDRETIHRMPPEGYAYPPAMAMLAVPMARMSTSGSLFTWFLVNAVAIMTVAGCSWMLVGGPRVVGMSRPWQAVFWLTVVLEARFFVASLEHQQFDMVIAALLLAGCVALWRGCDWRAGLLLGASAAMKCTPLLFGPWLLWRRKWKAAAAMAVVAVGLNVLPDVLFPQLDGNSYLSDWYRLMLAPVSQTAPGTWHTDLLLNQSLAGFAQRIARWLLVEHIGTDPNAVLSAATAQVLRITTYGTALFLLTITAWHFGRPFQAPARAPVRSSGPLPWSDLQIGAECSALVCLMLLLSPMSGKAHFCVLVLPGLFFARWMVERPSRLKIVLFAALLVCGTLTSRSLLSKSWSDLALFFGLPMWFTLAMLAVSWHMIGVTRERTTQFSKAPLPVRKLA